MGNVPRASSWRSGSISRSSELDLPASIAALDARLAPRLSEAASTWLSISRTEVGRDAALPAVRDALRANAADLFAAAICENGYTSRHLSDDLFNQAVLKCAFVGLRLERIERVEERGTPELARMLFAYVTEREHAGRSVGADLWPVIALHPLPGAVERIRNRLGSAADPYERRMLEVLPRYLEKDGVVAVGEIGFDDQTATEEKVFRVQIELAMRHELPLLVHLPHRDKVKGLERTLAIVGEMKVAPERVLIDHNTEETVPLVVET